jgi:hypothetical protein
MLFIRNAIEDEDDFRHAVKNKPYCFYFSNINKKHARLLCTVMAFV